MQSEHAALVVVDARLRALAGTVRYYLGGCDSGDPAAEAFADILEQIRDTWNAVPDAIRFRGVRKELDG